jgi:hypothetical protein
LSNFFIASAAALVCTSAGAWAQDPIALDDILGCRTIEDAMERLACFDRTSAEISGENMVVIDLDDIEEVERDGFGLNLPSLPRLSLAFTGRDRDVLEVAGTQDEDAEPAAPRDEGEGSSATPGEPQPQSRVLARADDGQIDEIELQVVNIRLRGYETNYVEMSNGQVWEIPFGERPASPEPSLWRG